MTDQWLSSTSPTIFWSVLTFANLAMFAFSALISKLWNKIFKLEGKPITSQDLTLSFVVIATNIAIAIPGYWLFLNGWIQFQEKSFEGKIFDTFLLTLILDVFMYFLHFSAHRIPFAKLLHERHHEHVDLNEISLYVMNPLEAMGLGCVITLVCFSGIFDADSLMLYLFINWAWGTFAHLVAKKGSYGILGNHYFHNLHHKYGNCNFGFYTTLWDRLFQTLHQPPKKS